jgi:hypothetical protein
MTRWLRNSRSDIGYSVSGRHRVLMLGHDLQICGDVVDCDPTHP